MKRQVTALTFTLLAIACASAAHKPDDPTATLAEAPTESGPGPARSGAPASDPPLAAIPSPRPPLAASQPPPAATRHTISPGARDAYQAGLGAAQAGDCPKALVRFEEALRNDPVLGWAAYNQGICLEKLGQTAKAKDSYRRALIAQPDLTVASENLTRLQLRLNQGAEAEAELRARAGQPNAPVTLHTQLAEVLEAQGRFDLAAGEAKVVLKADERNVPAMLVLAQIYYDQKRNELSRMVADNARQIDVQNPTAYNLLGALDLADKNRNLAIEDFKKATELREDFPEAQNNLGALLVAAQDYPSAIKHLELAVRDAPLATQPHLNLGNAYRGNKQYDLAKTEYQKVLQLDPRQRDPYFNLGVLFLDGEPTGVAPTDRYNQAIAYFDQFKGAGGQDPKLEQYVKDAQKAIGQEKRRLEVEAKNKLRKEAEARKKASEPPPPPLSGPKAPAGSKLGEGSAPPSARPPAQTPSPSIGGQKLQGGK